MRVQAVFNRHAAAREGENTEVGTRFLCLLFFCLLSSTLKTRKCQNLTQKRKNTAIGVFVKRNFLGAGKSYMIKGKQAEKKAENALCGRLKCVLVAGNIKPLPTSEKRLRQG